MRPAFFKIVLSLLIITCSSLNIFSQVPAGFNYQAIARDEAGNLLHDTELRIIIGILTSLDPENVVYEARYDVVTNSMGLFQLMVGDPAAVPITGTFSGIDWTVPVLYIRTKVYWNLKWQDMGSARLLSVPYAMVSQAVSGLEKLSVNGTTTNQEEALFEVKNNLNQTVFAVYNEGIRVGVAGANKGTKGGFAIGSLDGTKGGTQYFKVYPDSTRIFVNNQAKGIKGGFAIGGLDGGKGEFTGNYMDITPKNYFIGHGSGSLLTTGSFNSVLGYHAARSVTSGNSNTVIGHLADSSLTTGNNNIIIGETAGFRLNTGNHNTLIGSSAGFNHTNQQYNVLIGTASGANIISPGDAGSYNTFMGINSGYQIRNSRDNVFLGTNAGYWLDNGRGNTFVGIDAGRTMGEGGPWPYRSGVAADYNIFMGYRAGYYIANGDNNLAIGYESGYNIADGTGNVFLGYQAGRAETGSNKLYISNSTTNNLIYGDFSTKRLGINTTTLNKTLNVGGDAEVTGNLSAASLTGSLTGSVNGATMNRFFFSNISGIVASIFSDKFDVYWNSSTKTVQLRSTHASTYCFFRILKMTLGTGGLTYESSGILNTTKTLMTFVDNGDSCEITFGDETGTSTCTVWIQYSNSKIFGHYIKY